MCFAGKYLSLSGAAMQDFPVQLLLPFYGSENHTILLWFLDLINVKCTERTMCGTENKALYTDSKVRVWIPV